MDKSLILHITVDRGGKVFEILDFLKALNNAYENIYYIDLIINELKSNNDIARKSIRKLKPRKFVSDIILPEDILRITKVNIGPPGFIDFKGLGEVAKQIREYINDRDERRKDREWREAETRKSMELDNDKKKFELFEDKIRFLKENGFPEDEIRKLINNNGIEPLEELDKFQDSGLISSAEIKLTKPQNRNK
jgi:hypothetical protein